MVERRVKKKFGSRRIFTSVHEDSSQTARSVEDLRTRGCAVFVDDETGRNPARDPLTVFVFSFVFAMGGGEKKRVRGKLPPKKGGPAGIRTRTSTGLPKRATNEAAATPARNREIEDGSPWAGHAEGRKARIGKGLPGQGGIGWQDGRRCGPAGCRKGPPTSGPYITQAHVA